MIDFRKMILQYFGEDTSSLTMRPDCCDNCERGVSSWSCNDLYHGFIGNEMYDFTYDSLMLLNTIKQMEAKENCTTKECIVQTVRGMDYSRLDHQTQHYDERLSHAPYFWNALIDQLMCAEYIQTVPGKKSLTLSNLARQWLQNPTNLIQKPEGAMYRFFKTKQNTPHSNFQWNDNYRERRSIITSTSLYLY